MTRLRFDGAIVGIGTVSGTRLVLGLWPTSPFGAIYDAMLEQPDGHRVLIAPTAEVGDFIAATYSFDEIRVEATALRIAGRCWTFSSDSLEVTVEAGRRTALGHLLGRVPRPLARSRWWCRVIDPLARRIRRGVRTFGTAGGGRQEWYAALDEHALRKVDATWEGRPLGALSPVDPPVRFGFGSTPRRPSLVRVTSMVHTDNERGGGPGADELGRG